MKQLKIVKNMYIVMDVCLIIVGLLILHKIPPKELNTSRRRVITHKLLREITHSGFRSIYQRDVVMLD